MLKSWRRLPYIRGESLLRCWKYLAKYVGFLCSSIFLLASPTASTSLAATVTLRCFCMIACSPSVYKYSVEKSHACPHAGHCVPSPLLALKNRSMYTLYFSFHRLAFLANSFFLSSQCSWRPGALDRGQRWLLTVSILLRVYKSGLAFFIFHFIFFLLFVLVTSSSWKAIFSPVCMAMRVLAIT